MRLSPEEEEADGSPKFADSSCGMEFDNSSDFLQFSLGKLDLVARMKRSLPSTIDYSYP